MLLVTLVVVGHAWTLLPDDRVAGGLFDFLYAWHVPAFVMVTGYLSRSFTWTRRDLSERCEERNLASADCCIPATLRSFPICAAAEENSGWRVETPCVR